jgi:hypothetical protein
MASNAARSPAPPADAIRYCGHSELDLMASHAGLRLAERYGVQARPYDEASSGHLFVYRPAWTWST